MIPSNAMDTAPHPTYSPRRLAVVGGLGALGPVDLFFKLAQALPACGGDDQAELAFEQCAFREGDTPGAAGASQNGRKLYVFDMVRRFEARGAEAVLVPCFVSHTFLAELRSELQVPIVDMMEAIRSDILRRHPGVRRIGVLTSDYVREKRLFEAYFPGPDWALHFPSQHTQQRCVMNAIYGRQGLKTGHLRDGTVALLCEAADELVANGAELIVPGFSEIPVIIDALRARGLPVLDSNQSYVRAALASPHAVARQAKVGVVGGVGPAATVDFLSKIVKNTPAGRDQDHIKVVVEQNPQIPDRTANLIGEGADPTVALYSTCKRLEAAGADIIAIPCNTAHAFVERIQPYLSVPIINMLDTTIEHLKSSLPTGAKVGLLATQGTIESGIYAEAADGSGLELLAPDEPHQRLVMSSIYGPRGVKAGFTTGTCKDELEAALLHLVDRGATAIILGCTELPLLIQATPSHRVGHATVLVVDPTDLLARRCVQAGTSTLASSRQQASGTPPQAEATASG